MTVSEAKDFWNKEFTVEPIENTDSEFGGKYNSYEKRLGCVPADGETGKFEGERGNSKFIPSDETERGAVCKEKLAEYGKDGIEYKNLEPDFSEVSEGTVKIDNMTEHRDDYYDENGYRFYSYSQLNLFYFISMMKELGMSLDEIKFYLNSRTPEQMEELFTSKINQISNEIKRLKENKRILKSRIDKIQYASEVKIDKIYKEYQEEEYYLRYRDIDDPTDKDVYKLFEDNFSKYTSIKGLDTSRYSIITIEEICGEYRYNHEYILKKINKKVNSHKLVVKQKG